MHIEKELGMGAKRILYFVLLWVIGFACLFAGLVFFELALLRDVFRALPSSDIGGGPLLAMMIWWGVVSWKSAKDARLKRIVIHYLKLYAIGFVGTFVFVGILQLITAQTANANKAYVPSWWALLSFTIVLSYIVGGLWIAHGITRRKFSNLGAKSPITLPKLPTPAALQTRPQSHADKPEAVADESLAVLFEAHGERNDGSGSDS
jgi:hypothetical protein